LNDLSGLSALVSVEGDFGVAFGSISNLDGLSSLSSVGGRFWIWDADSLNDIGGLSALTYVGGDFALLDTQELASVDGLALSTVGGNLQIERNEALAELDGFSELASIGGGLYIRENPVLTTLDGLSKLDSVGGAFWLLENHALTSLDGLEGLRSVGGEVDISFNGAFTDVDALSGLRSVGGTLEVRYNSSVEGSQEQTSRAYTDGPGEGEVFSTPALVHPSARLTNSDSQLMVGGISPIGADARSRDNRGIASGSDVLSNLAILGDLVVEENSRLTNLDGLSNLNEVGGSILVMGNDSLVSIAAIQSLTSVVDLRISDNTALQGLDGLSSIEEISGSLRIWGNHGLANLDPLSNIVEIGEDLGIGYVYWAASGNDGLVNIDGLSHIRSVGGSLLVAGNQALTDIDGLSGVITIGKDVLIIENDSLRSLDGFSSVDSVGGDFTVRSNGSLSECSRGIYNLVSQAGVVGSILMRDNAEPGDCNNDGQDLVAVSNEEVLVDVDLPSSFALHGAYPDPFRLAANIMYDLPEPAQVSLSIFDCMGRRVVQLSSGWKSAGHYTSTFDATGVPAGVYFYRLTAGDHVETRSVVLTR
jgi:hypothetical protein